MRHCPTDSEVKEPAGFLMFGGHAVGDAFLMGLRLTFFRDTRDRLALHRSL